MIWIKVAVHYYKLKKVQRIVGTPRSHCAASRCELHCAVCTHMFLLCLEIWLCTCSRTRLPTYIWLSQTCLSASLCNYLQGKLLFVLVTAPLSIPGYQNMCYMTKRNLIFQFFPASVGEHYHCPFCSAGLCFSGHTLEHRFFFCFS